MDTSDSFINFPLSHCNFQEELYENLLQEKVSNAKVHIASEIVISPDVLSSCAILKSPTRYFRARCKLSIKQTGPDNALDYFIWEGASEDSKYKGQMVIKSYPIASIQINKIMPRLLHHIDELSGELKDGLCAVSFLSTTSGEILVSLIYNRPLSDSCSWMRAAERLRDLLSLDLLEGINSINIMARSRKIMLCVGNTFVNERFSLADGRVLLYRQPEGAFSNPNSNVSRHALDWLSETFRAITATGSMNLLEMYCGNGNHTVALAGLVSQVVAVELSDALCAAARENLAMNEISNATIVNVKAERFAHSVLKGRQYDDIKFDCVLVDPPRCGLDETTCRLVCGYDHIVYISCNPLALARDVKAIQSAGAYTVARMSAMDQFAYTPHLEIGVYLAKVSGDA